MTILLTLRNFENEYVASGYLCLSECRYAPPEIRQYFSDKILKYNWQEDQSDFTAVSILRDTMVELSEGAIKYEDVELITDDYNGGLNERALELVKNNTIKGYIKEEAEVEYSSSDFANISFNVSLCMADVMITLSKEDGEEVR